MGASALLPVRAEEPAARVGSFSAAFREDGFARPGTAGCRPGPNGLEDCLPPGATRGAGWTAAATAAGIGLVVVAAAAVLVLRRGSRRRRP